MWPPCGAGEDTCNYGFVDHHQQANQYDHYHHHHFPHTSENHFDCYQTFSCPSALPEESGHYSPPLTQYQELTSSPTTPPFISPEPHHHHHHHHHHCQSHEQDHETDHQFYCQILENCSHEPRCVDRSNIPKEQSAIFEEISKECEHLLKSGECEKCNVKHDNGGEEAIPIDDLVDIVMQTVENFKKTSPDHEESKMLNRKRAQNKVAAARYRDKQKSKWQEMINEMSKEELRNKELKVKVKGLEKEVAEWRAKFFEKIVGKGA